MGLPEFVEVVIGTDHARGDGAAEDSEREVGKVQ